MDDACDAPLAVLLSKWMNKKALVQVEITGSWPPNEVDFANSH